MDFLTYLKNHIVLFDGAMGTEIQKLPIQDSEWGGYSGCNEMLSLSAPDRIAGIHRAYLEAGADVIETNTFGANRIVLSEYGLEERTREINKAAAQLAVHERDQYLGRTPSERPVYVAGSLGPGTKLPSLGQTDFDTVHTSYYQQALGLIEGGAELFIIETSQDLLQIKAAVLAVRDASAAHQLELPLIVSVTVETNGSMLVGSDINTVTSALLPMDIDVVGINCATGPQEMRPHIEELSRQFPGALFCMPNAGFPEHKNGELVYSLSPAEFADVLTAFVSDFGVDVIGGCCGSDPSFIAELRSRIPNLTKGYRGILHKAALTSLYSRIEFDQQPPPFFIGERTNTNGSKKFRTHLLENDWDSMVSMGKKQMKTGAHALDVCVAYTGRDEQHDMQELVRRLRTNVDLPLVIDSTNPEVLESALKLMGGRGLINSVNLEDGEAAAGVVFSLAKRYGAAVICLTIDEAGMARTAEKKLSIAERIYRIATESYGLRPEDLVFDPLTFTLGSGDESLRIAGSATLTALGLIKKKMPGVHTVLGVSNISFGLKPHSREVLNSVFLERAIQAGLDIAIVNVKKIIPVFKIPEADVTAALDLIYNRGSDDPLRSYITHFSNKETSPVDAQKNHENLSPEEQLEELVLEGTHAGLLPVLDALLKHTAPDTIINSLLIPAMKRVGELFGKGKLQLPFVLQSAEVMKQAVGYLESFMEKQAGAPGKSVVLATVRGDVHDIGKNLVDIILSNNGYKVYNLGIKVDIDTILKKAQEVRAGAIGMSGLLVKSTGIMKTNIETMHDRNLHIPVLLGGAALTREFVEQECAPLLNAPIFYCKDAFDGLQAMGRVEEAAEAALTDAPRKAKQSPPPEVSSEAGSKPQAPPESMERASHAVPLPESNEIQQLNLNFESLLPYINRKRLFRARWGYRRGASSEQEYLKLEETTIQPEFEKLIAWLAEGNITPPKAAFRLLPCNRTGDNQIRIFEDGSQPEFYFTRQLQPPHLSVADYFLPDSAGRQDLIGLQIVTLGTAIQREIHRLFSNDNYRDYLHLHGLAVELAEAGAEYVQTLMQSELQFPESGNSGNSIPATRYSFGYPCCPDLAANRTIAALLNAEELGISFTEDDQMVPELSTAAFVCFNPQADYFSI
ncbi:MAG: methionine synthase [Spirochaetaceae bacterium]|nr:methionine synthase [Spirochaetaceae bacterium]MCF7947569.1 methionine synthase [Spirochaetia bacterium]MCF7950493.1 methionine synthase [Spirochaetaceae bacterium]